jgi:hypothetical protein
MLGLVASRQIRVTISTVIALGLLFIAMILFMGVAKANHDGQTQYSCQTTPQVCGANETFCEATGSNISQWVTKHKGACDPSNGEHNSDGCIYEYQINSEVFSNLTCTKTAMASPACTKDQVVGSKEVCNGNQLCNVNIHSREDCSRYDGGFYNCRSVVGQCGVSQTSSTSYSCFVCDTASDGKSRFRSTSATNCNDQTSVCDASKADQGACRSSSSLSGTSCGPQPTITQSQGAPAATQRTIIERITERLPIINNNNNNTNTNTQSVSVGGVVPATVHYIYASSPTPTPTPTPSATPTSSPTAQPTSTPLAVQKVVRGSSPGVTYVSPVGISELPRTGLPLAAWATASLLPFGVKLRRFGKKQQTDSATSIWEKRQLRRSE